MITIGIDIMTVAEAAVADAVAAVRTRSQCSPLQLKSPAATAATTARRRRHNHSFPQQHDSYLFLVMLWYFTIFILAGLPRTVSGEHLLLLGDSLDRYIANEWCQRKFTPYIIVLI
jgi:hypothetical protein